MKLPRTLRKLSRKRRLRRASTSLHIPLQLEQLTRNFCAADTLTARARRLSQLFGWISAAGNQRDFNLRLVRWIRLLERDPILARSLADAWNDLVSDLDSVSLLAEAGLPGHHALTAEIMRRIFQRLLPSAREQRDTSRLFAAIFSNHHIVSRFVSQPPRVFRRLEVLLRPSPGTAAATRLESDLRQALCLLATRVAGRGNTAAIRQRGSSRDVSQSPFYLLLFQTQVLAASAPGRERHLQFASWQRVFRECLDELEQIHLHMEDAGVSSALVYDLRSIEASLGRMRLLTLVYAPEPMSPAMLPEAAAPSATHELVNTLVRGRLDDTRLRYLFRENLNLLARKTVERTGHGGEHYIAHTRANYWHMWRAAAGGGLLTVFTAAIKMRLLENHLPLAVEGFLIGTDYAVSFLLLQIFGFALATKQPSMTAATLAGIIRENRGVARLQEISDFAADISRTQLAAAFSNIIAVCAGAVLFEEVWAHMFRAHYLPAASAQHVYQTLHPFTSGTAIFAAFTGVLLWLAALIGGWCENFAVYHRVPEAIAQHPLGTRLGTRRMRAAANWLERSVAGWSTSIVLGYLLGFAPVVASFFGLPLDVRHVTLSTGTLALAAARFGTESFREGWLYYAAAGIGITFILNLSVSFLIASIVALRAYDVPRAEQIQILRFLLKEFFSSPLHFIFPAEVDMPSIAVRTALEEQD